MSRWTARTEFGRKLLALRMRCVMSGQALLDMDGVARELARRRSGAEIDMGAYLRQVRIGVFVRPIHPWPWRVRYWAGMRLLDVVAWLLSFGGVDVVHAQIDADQEDADGGSEAD